MGLTVTEDRLSAPLALCDSLPAASAPLGLNITRCKINGRLCPSLLVIDACYRWRETARSSRFHQPRIHRCRAGRDLLLRRSPNGKSEIELRASARDARSVR